MTPFHTASLEGLSHLRIAMIGTGAVGSCLAQLLMEAGVRDVLLIDPQRLEQRNHATSPFLRQALARHCGGCAPFKADLLAEEAARLGIPGWTALSCEIGDAGWQSLATCDAIVCCTDSALSRVETAYTARTLAKPMLEAGVVEQGELRCRYAWFPATTEAACYLCGLREESRAQVLAHAASATLGCAALEESASMTGAPAAVQHAAAGLLRLLQQLANGSLPDMAMAFRCTGVADRAETVAWQDEPLQPARSQTCPWHEPLCGELLALPWETPLHETLPAAGAADRVLQLGWPLCTEARCTRCGRQATPFQRVAFVRRSAPCPHCGEKGVLQPVRTQETISPGDPLRAMSPRQLGQPQHHLYLLRKPVFCSGDVQSTWDKGMEAS